MKRNLLTALIVGLLASGALYYIWCSLQWRQAAQQAPQPAQAQTATLQTGNGTTIATTQTPLPAHTFAQAGALTLEGRLGNAYLLANQPGRTHVALVASTGDAPASLRRPVAAVTLVIDRSGSMQGDRIANVIAAGEYVLDNLRDGDTISVVSYSSGARVEVPATMLTPATRGQVRASLRMITVGGGTCISCGLEYAEAELTRMVNADSVHRVILLSDGQANQGTTDLASLEAQAKRIERSGAIVTTVGVGLDYNETLMARIAVGGNGNHYFVENATRLASTLGTELASVRSLIAKGTTATFELPMGVRFVKGYGRDFQVIGNQIIVSLGDLPENAERTVLFEVDVDPAAQGIRTISTVRVAYADIAAGMQRTVQGELNVAITGDLAEVDRGRDGIVGARIEQAALADALAAANEHIERGDFEQAEQALEAQWQASTSANADYGSAKLDRQLDSFKAVKEDLKKAETRTATGGKRRQKTNATIQRGLLE